MTLNEVLKFVSAEAAALIIVMGMFLFFGWRVVSTLIPTDRDWETSY